MLWGWEEENVISNAVRNLLLKKRISIWNTQAERHFGLGKYQTFPFFLGNSSLFVSRGMLPGLHKISPRLPGEPPKAIFVTSLLTAGFPQSDLNP